MSTAPVCPISRSQPIAPQPERLLPAAINAMDLPSLIKAVNSAINQFNLLRTPGPPANNLNLGMMFPSMAKPSGGIGNVFDNWLETSRVVDDRIRVYHRDSRTRQFDYTQYVEVSRIYDVTFHEGGSVHNEGVMWQAIL